MKNKKGGVTVAVLVVSILIISSGVVITNAVKGSDSGESVFGTGLTLFDKEQTIYETSLDSSENEKEAIIFKDSKKDSKKSSGSGGSSGSANSWVSGVNDVEDMKGFDANETTNYAPEDGLSVNDTEKNQTETNHINQTLENKTSYVEENETFKNNTKENQTELNSTEVVVDINLTDGQVFEQNGTSYIVRDGLLYDLASSEIEFSSFLPSSICVMGNGRGEKIDISIEGEFKASGNLNSAVHCLYNDYIEADLKLKLMESDLFSFDDLIIEKALRIRIDCEDSKVKYSHTFNDVDLGPQFEELGDKGKIEVYGLVELSGKYVKDDEYSTPNYDINKLECECIQGSCCDMRSRPYKYKSVGSQPTGYEDYYFCDGSNSPTSTNYCAEYDYYCNGNSAGYSHSVSIVDTCGICEYCTNGDPTCNYYSSSTKCGERDCDYLDTACRNYHDVDKFCSGNSGTCTNSNCDSYTDAEKHTSCGENQECDGDGVCVTCNSQEYYLCSDEDVYWYDVCDNRGEKKEECGEYSESGWNYYCSGDDKWRKKSCTGRGCSHDACWRNYFDCYETFVETCEWGCENGQCKSNPNIECYQDADCGKNGLVGEPICSEDDVYQSFREHTCENPGTEDSYCIYSDTSVLIEDCGEDKNNSNYCYSEDVYMNFTDRGCLSGSCFENTTSQFVEDCGENENSSAFCYDGDVYINMTNKGCSNQSCFINMTMQSIEDCEHGCSNGSCMKPDLTIIDLAIQNIKEKTVVLAFTVKNIGEIATDNVYWMVDTNSTDENPERMTSANLEPGTWTRAYMMWTYSQSGIYRPEAIVDFEDLIEESNESNNQLSINLSV